MFIYNKTALRTTQVAKPSVFCMQSFSKRRIQLDAEIMRFNTFRLFSLGYVKNKVYDDAPQLIQEMNEKIRAVID